MSVDLGNLGLALTGASNIASALGFGGGGDGINRWEDRWRSIQYDEARRQFERQIVENRNVIKSRVEDAKRAGVHPLYALGQPGVNANPTVNFAGGSGGGYSTHAGGSAVEGLGSLGETLQTYGVRKEQAKRSAEVQEMARQTHEAQLLEMRASAQRDFVSAQLAQARIDEITRAARGAPGALNLGVQDTVEGLIDKQPAQQLTTGKKKSDTAGVHPAMVNMTMPGAGNETIRVKLVGQPGMEMSEAYEMTSAAGWYNLVATGKAYVEYAGKKLWKNAPLTRRVLKALRKKAKTEKSARRGRNARR